jgi:hypothetical protein
MDDGTLRFDEASARQLLLARAIDEVDTQGKLLSEVERDQLERQALEASRGGAPEAPLVPAAYLRERSRLLLTAVENRNPQLAALQDPEPWRRWLLWLLPLAACVLGAAIDRIDNPRSVNMLSPPLLGVVAWNLAMYLLLVAALFLPADWHQRGPLPAVQRWLAGIPRQGRRTGKLRVDVAARFHQHWLHASSRQQLLWARQLLHLTAAGWALGLGISIVLGGVVRQYRVGWESTLLDVGQVHAFLRALFAPVVLLTPLPPFSLADLQRMAFASGAAIGVDEARRWIWMYLALLALVVLLPRALLAAWAAWRRARLASAVAIDLRDPYYVELLARVSPARITLALLATPGSGTEALLRIFEQAADHPRPGSGPWTVLTSGKGDVLRVFELPPGFQPPAAVATAAAAGGNAAQVWLQDLLVRFKGPRGGAGAEQGLQAALAEADLVLLQPRERRELAGTARLLHWIAQPALLLVDGADEEELQAWQAEVQRHALPAEVLDLQASAAHWLRDPLLLEAIAGRLPASKRAGFARVAAAWSERGERRFGEAMQRLALFLARSAHDSEEVGAAPVSLRQLVNAGERQAGLRARDAASQALLQRLRLQEGAVFAGLLQLHRRAAPAAPLAAARLEDGLVLQQAVDTPQAGMAGAATGAAMGAGIDLMAGGLTLGAATALGAVIGGGAAYVAAALKNRASPGGQSQVQLGDDTLQTLAEQVLLSYLVVAHRTAGESLPGSWRSEVVAAVAARREALSPLWAQARTAPDQAVPALARELSSLARGLLGRL